MNTDTDFRKLTDRQIAEYLTRTVADFEDDVTASTLTPDAIIEKVEQGQAVIVAECDAVAVIRPEGYRADKGEPVLWLLYVKPDSRGQGIGKVFVRDLRRRFEQSLPMILVCNGPRRESFFAACGFLVKRRYLGGRTTMQAAHRSETT